MTLMRFAMWSSVAGAIISIAIRAVWGAVNSSLSIGVGVKVALQKITLILWPSSLLMMAATSDRMFSLKLFLISTLMNVVLYSGVGVCVWYGLTKNRILLLAPIVVMSVIWWRLLSLR